MIFGYFEHHICLWELHNLIFSDEGFWKVVNFKWEVVSFVWVWNRLYLKVRWPFCTWFWGWHFPLPREWDRLWEVPWFDWNVHQVQKRWLHAWDFFPCLQAFLDARFCRGEKCSFFISWVVSDGQKWIFNESLFIYINLDWIVLKPYIDFSDLIKNNFH